MNQIAVKLSLGEIEARRNKAIDEYMRAHSLIIAANQTMTEASNILKIAAPSPESYHFEPKEREKIFGAYEVAEEEQFRRLVTKMVDVDVWTSLIRTSDLMVIMDKTAKDELRQSFVNEAPVFTADNAMATLNKFQLDAGMIFRRGIAEAFTKLDRCFKSHSGWKIGHRVILERAFDDDGWWNYHRNHQDTFTDIERTFYILDGKKPPKSWTGIVAAIDEQRKLNGWGANAYEVTSEFFKVRIFKNGNAHIWFQREDLVKLANRLIGEYYGEVIPEERKYGETEKEEEILRKYKMTPAKNHGFFPTPDRLADSVVDRADLYEGRGGPYRVLEPSAGTGQLARRCVRENAIVDCIEIQADNVLKLKEEGIYNAVVMADFLKIDPKKIKKYDRVVMNPPFDAERDIDHVVHALEFLKEDGILIAIMSAHTEFSSSKKAVAFRNRIEKLQGVFRDNPPGSFASVGTYVNTVTLKVRKDGLRIW